MAAAPHPPLLQRSLLAMTWASQAKDAHFASLASDLHSTLESARACAEQLSFALDRNRMLEDEVQENRRSETVLKNRLSDALKRLETAEVAEERLGLQIGDLEAESFQRAVETRKLVRSLNERLNEKEKLLEDTQSELQRRSRSLGDNVEVSSGKLLDQSRPRM